MVFELLVADQPAREAHDPQSEVLGLGRRSGRRGQPLSRARGTPDSRSQPRRHRGQPGCLHHCNLCVRACREVQVNDVIGMAYRGHGAKIVFDFDDPMGDSTCVACGECVQACPTGALMPATMLDDQGRPRHFRGPGRRQRLPLLRRRLPDHGTRSRTTRSSSVDGRDGPANEQPALREGPLRLRLHRPSSIRLTKPLIRRDDAPKDPATSISTRPTHSSHFREATWEEALETGQPDGLKAILDEDDGPPAMAGFGSAKGSNEEAYLFQKAGAHRLRHQQCRPLHAPVPRLLRRRSDGMHRFGRRDRPVHRGQAIPTCIIVIGANPAQNHPVAATYLKQAAKTRGNADRHGPAASQGLSRYADHMLQFKPGPGCRHCSTP